MNKDEFLEELEYKLRGLPEEDYHRAMNYYKDRISNANYPTDADVTRLLGTPDEAAREVLNKTYNKPVKIPKEKHKSHVPGCLFGTIAFLVIAVFGARFLVRHFHVKLPWNIPFITATEMESGTVNLDKFESMNIEADTAEIDVVFTGKEYKLDYELDSGEPVATVENGKLTVKQNKKSGTWFSFGSDNKIKIYVPEDAQLSLAEIKTDTGSIYVDDGVIDELTMNTDTGSVHCNHNDCKKLKMLTDTGSSHIELTAAESAEIKVSTGSIHINKSEIPSLTCKSSTGSLTIEDTTFDMLTAGLNTGSATVKSNGSLSDYNMDLKTDTGSIKLNGDKQEGSSYHQDGKTNKGIKIETDTGSIKVEIN